MDEFCHCGSPMKGSDHCPFCYCEQYESVCDAVFEDDLVEQFTDRWTDNYRKIADSDGW